MLKGSSVKVIRREKVGTDELHEAVYETTEEYVDNVLISPGTTEDATERMRPEGEDVAYTLIFPKTYTKSLRNCQVVIEGQPYFVAGDPKGYTACPTAWNRKVEVYGQHD